MKHPFPSKNPLYSLILAAALPFAGALAQDEDGNSDPAFEKDSGYREIELFTRILELVRQNYVDEEKVTYEELIGNALEGMLAGLDPHSQFMHKPVFEQLRNTTGSTYEGVGITISVKKEILTVVAVREDGPAARAGVLAGDQIIRINGLSTQKVGLAEAVELLKGKPGQRLDLTLRRPANRDLIEVEMIREVLQHDTVRDTRLLQKSLTGPYKIGYIRLLQFSAPTASQLAERLDELEEKGMKALVLDLRNNPGGLLDSAVDVCGEFLSSETLVLTTEGRPDVADIIPYSTRGREDRDRSYPLAILINQGSASGAEIVSGALQDLRRAVIVGTTSFGKGSVQSIMPTGSGTAIRLTTAKYYTPSKRTIHEHGVTPDIIVSVTPQEERQLTQWRRRNELNAEEQEDLEGFRDRQLSRAVDALKGALIYRDIEKPAAPPEPVPAE